MDFTRDERIYDASLTAASLEEFPRPKALASPQVTPGDVQDVLTNLTIRPALQAEPRAVVDFSTNRVDMRYNLIGIGQHVKEEVAVGRVWSPARCAIHWGVSSDWGAVPTALVPAAAGAAASIPDRNTAAAVAQMPTLFFKTTPTAEFGAAVRRSVEMLAREDTNCVRFVWRLAALYIGVRICEEMAGGTAGGVQMGCGAPVDIRYIDQVAGLTSLLSDEINRDVVPYKVNVSTTNEATSVRVLAMAASDKWQWPQMELSSVLRHMPPLNRAFVAVFGDQANVQVGGLMCSAQVWDVASSWTNGYSDPKLLIEAVEAISALLYSPNGSAPIWQTDGVRLALPASKMRALVLGPLTAKYATWEEAAPNMEEPQLKAAVLRGANISLLLSLGVRHAAMLQGTALVAAPGGSAFEHLFMPQQYASRRSGVPLMAAAGKILAALGVDGHVGRILLRVGMPQPEVKQVLDWWRKSDVAPQWEEALQHLQALPSGSALYGMFHPLKTVQLMQPSWWYIAGKVPGGLTPCEAVRGLASYISPGDIRFAYETFNFATRQVNRVDVHEEMSYRGVPGDWHVMPTVMTSGMRVTTAFNISTSVGCAQAYAGPMARSDVRWFMEKTTYCPQDAVFPEDQLPSNPMPVPTFVTANPPVPAREPPESSGGEARGYTTPESSSPKSNRDIATTEEGGKPLYDPDSVIPQRMKLARALNTVSVALLPIDVSGAGRDWWTGLDTVLLTSSPGELEEKVAYESAQRQIMDGWIQTHIMQSLRRMKPAERLDYTRSMVEIGKFCAERPLSAVEVHHSKTNLSLWKAALSSMSIDPSITKDEVVESLKGKANPDAVAAAMGMINVDLLVKGGDNVKVSVLTLAEKMTTRGEVDVTKTAAAEKAKEALERSAREAHEAMIAENHRSMREAVEAGIVTSKQLVYDIFGFMPEWVSEYKWDEDGEESPAEVPHNPSGMGDAPSTVLHDDGVLASQVDAKGKAAAEYLPQADEIASSSKNEQDFGLDGATTSASQGARPTPSQVGQTGTEQSLIVDFE